MVRQISYPFTLKCRVSTAVVFLVIFTFWDLPLKLWCLSLLFASNWLDIFLSKLIALYASHLNFIWDFKMYILNIYVMCMKFFVEKSFSAVVKRWQCYYKHTNHQKVLVYVAVAPFSKNRFIPFLSDKVPFYIKNSMSLLARYLFAEHIQRSPSCVFMFSWAWTTLFLISD